MLSAAKHTVAQSITLIVLVAGAVVAIPSAPAEAATLRRVAVVPFLFDGQSEPYPISDVEAAVFGNGVDNNGLSVANYVREDSSTLTTSGGVEAAAAIVGDVIGGGSWIRTRAQATDGAGRCLYVAGGMEDWRNQIYAVIDETVLDNYDTVLFLGSHPCLESDGYGPQGEPWVMVRRLDAWWTMRLVLHEFNHSIGLLHSNQLWCAGPDGQPVPISTECSVHGYDDPFSVMGDWRLKLDNGVHMAQLGYLPMSNISAPDRGTAGTSVTIRLTPAHPILAPVPILSGQAPWPFLTLAPGYQMIQIDRCRTVICYNAQDGRRFMYLEFRHPYGAFDQSLASDEDFSESSEVARGLTVRLGRAYNEAPSLSSLEALVLIDTNPGTPGATGSRDDFLDAPLDPGESLEDPIGAFTITHAGSGIAAYGTTTTPYIDVRITWLPPFPLPFPLPNLRLPCFLPGTLSPCPWPGPGPVLPGPFLPGPFLSGPQS